VNLGHPLLESKLGGRYWCSTPDGVAFPESGQWIVQPEGETTSNVVIIDKDFFAEHFERAE